VETWRFVQRAGAKALSVAVDFSRKRLAEVSFVSRPRVKSAQVFSNVQPGDIVDCRLSIDAYEDGVRKQLMGLPGDGRVLSLKEAEEMTSVRQFAEGLMGYLKGVVEEGTVQVGRQELAQERELFHQEQTDAMVLDLKRRGLLRASESACEAARALLAIQDTNVTQFGADVVPIRRLFHRFLEANGPVWPVGEVAPALAGAGAGSTDRLIAMAKERALRDGKEYVAAFNEVAKEHPQLAAAVRVEGL
jgi:hypothetical protein